jgi:hypothetical protein
MDRFAIGRRPKHTVGVIVRRHRTVTICAIVEHGLPDQRLIYFAQTTCAGILLIVDAIYRVVVFDVNVAGLGTETTTKLAWVDLFAEVVFTS